MHKILADQCINRDTVEALRLVRGVEVVHASEVSLATAPDTEIFEYARKHNFVLFTFDRGFGDIRTFDPRKIAGTVIVYVEDFTRKSLVRESKEFFESHTPKSLRGKGFIIQPGRVRPFGSD